MLRESAQCPTKDKKHFQNIQRYRFFNTNNIWIDLTFLKRLIERDGFIKLPMILNPKNIDPRDKNSPPVFQVETAMGSAISLFEGAKAVRVPRSRFIPVKSTNDLLALRSNSSFSDSDSSPRFTVHSSLFTALIDLDPRYYKHLDQFEERFSKGIPNLAECSSLTLNCSLLTAH